jgi:formiminotetrahydrofolate cyclodeaminase
VRINCKGFTDKTFVADALQRAEKLMHEATTREASIMDAVLKLV